VPRSVLGLVPTFLLEVLYVTYTVVLEILTLLNPPIRFPPPPRENPGENLFLAPPFSRTDPPKLRQKRISSFILLLLGSLVGAIFCKKLKIAFLETAVSHQTSFKNGGPCA
jgi:hypothetical protein